MINPEVNQILNEFESMRKRMKNPPKKKSNRDFVGHVFATIALKHMATHISSQYNVVSGPLWIQGLEWIEWDGAVIRSGSKEIFENYHNPQNVVALFELKSGGIYGRKSPQKGKGRTLQEVIDGIRRNFCEAGKICPNLKRCFYVSLHERKPKRKDSINYYGETKKLEPKIVTCILFESSSLEKKRPLPFNGEWDRLAVELKNL